MNTSESGELPQPNPWRFEDAVACVAIVFGCFVLGLYACSLNHTVYQHQAPFYDSLSYNQAMADTMAQARKIGRMKALRGSLEGANNFFPSIVAVLVSRSSSPSRDTGIWIQSCELIVLCLSFYFYSRRVLQASTLVSASLILPILSLKVFYKVNGGISDFRMDLSLMVMFATTVVWYMIATATDRIIAFVTLGVVAGITILFRATAPVYFVFALGPCVLLDLLCSQKRIRFLCRLILAAFVTTLVGGWFLIVNFKYLYYYYVVWNIDAKAKSPLTESYKHLGFVVDHIGERLILFIGLLLVAAWLVRLYAGRNTTQFNSKREESFRKRLRPWCVAWIGVAPVVMLLVLGASTRNPFVCMPSALGIVLVLAMALGHFLSGRTDRRIELSCFAILSWLLVYQAHYGLVTHAPRETNAMNGHKQVIQAMAIDAKASGKQQVRYGVAYFGQMTTIGLRNVMTFDRKSIGIDLQVDAEAFVTDNTLSLFAPASWETVPGETMELKIAHLVATSKDSADYLMIPEPESCLYMADHFAHVVCSKYCGEIRGQLLNSGNWSPISEVITIDANEKIRVYKNASSR